MTAGMQMSLPVTPREISEFAARKRKRHRRRILTSCNDCSSWQTELNLGSLWNVVDSYVIDRVDEVSAWTSTRPYGGFVLSAKAISSGQNAKQEPRENAKNRREKLINFKKVSVLGLPVPISLKSSMFEEEEDEEDDSAVVVQHTTQQLVREPTKPGIQWKNAAPKLSVNMLIANLSLPSRTRTEIDLSKMEYLKEKATQPGRLSTRLPPVLPEVNSNSHGHNMTKLAVDGVSSSDCIFPFNLLKLKEPSNVQARRNADQNSNLTHKFPITVDEARKAESATRKASAKYGSRRSAGMRRLVMVNRSTTIPQGEKPEKANVYYLRYSNGIN